MKKLVNLKFINIFLVAILVLNQVAFLFLLTAPIKAETEINTGIIDTTTNYPTIHTTVDTDYTDSTNSTDNSSTATTETEPIKDYYVDIAPDINSETIIYNNTTDNLTTADTTTDNNFKNDTYINTDDDSNIFWDDKLIIETDSSTNYALTMNFISPPVEVSGQTAFYVKTNAPADIIFYISREGIQLDAYPAYHRVGTTYYLDLNTDSLVNGQYNIKAQAKNSYGDITKQIDITINNPVDDKMNDYTSDFNKETADDLSSVYEISFTELYQSPLFGDKRITVSVNMDIDRVDFVIEGPRHDRASGTKESPRKYYFTWYTSDFPNGYYKIIAYAFLNGVKKASRSLDLQIANNTSFTNKPMLTEFDNSYPKDTASMEQKVEYKVEYVEEKILSECTKNNITSFDECRQFINISPECRGKGYSNQEDCLKYLTIPPECRWKNISSQEKCNIYMSTPTECRNKGIMDKEECKNYLQKFSMPTECQATGATTPEECNKTIFINSLPAECQEAGVTEREECEKILKTQAFLTTECQQAKITEQAACDKYMSERILPPACREAGATTRQECDYILRNQAMELNKLTKVEFKPYSEEFKYFKTEYELPWECQEAGATTPEKCGEIMFFRQAPLECQKANITDPEKCKKHMMLVTMPTECQKANITDEKECRKILYKEYAPDECIDAEIDDQEKCEKYMFEKFLPIDCKEAGILTDEACKKYMFEKYGRGENIPIDKLPIECQQAGSTTLNECNSIMRKIYIPRECQDQGIDDEDECELYMQKKHMPRECQDAGAKTRSDCDKIMFKKFGPRECSKAGITNDQECKDLMFNKYAPRVTCRGIDDWQCKNSIKDRHLGNIVAKQIKFEELKEKIIYLQNGSVTIEELEANLEVAKDMIPIKGAKIGLKILAMKEELILDDGDNLFQTAPMALMFDSDQDGLPDDMEKRLGTNPEEADTDNDGYNDGAEVKNNYNPLGPGNLTSILAPIEQAIMGNKELEQPKVTGEVTEALTITDINNISDEENSDNGYIITGTAEPNEVVTLYFYSALPLIATVKTDEYGNWQYEFNESLIEGEHEIYVVLNDNTGKFINKSNPFSFFIKEAKAASVKDFIATAIPITSQTDTASLIKYYVIIAILTIFIGISLFVIFIIQKRKST